MAPERWSSTTLDEFQACPRRWQLTRSQWGEFPRFPVREHPAALEGTLVHEALDRLTKACAERGNPDFGTPEFREASTEADFFSGFERGAAEWQERLASHPRPGPPFRWRATPQELANRAIRLFRSHYRPGSGSRSGFGSSSGRGSTRPDAGRSLLELLRVRGVLSEVRLDHPTLPFVGVLDRVHEVSGVIEVVDNKSGRPKDVHRRQLLRYAVLWWRNTGVAPARVAAQYLEGEASWDVDGALLEDTERALTDELAITRAGLEAGPALAHPGAQCGSCPVRARCDPGWAAGGAQRKVGSADADLVVVSAPGKSGFLGRTTAGSEIGVVHLPAMESLLPSLEVGQTARVLDGSWNEDRSVLEIKPWTEVYLIRGGSA